MFPISNTADTIRCMRPVLRPESARRQEPATPGSQCDVKRRGVHVHCSVGMLVGRRSTAVAVGFEACRQGRQCDRLGAGMPGLGKLPIHCGKGLREGEHQCTDGGRRLHRPTAWWRRRIRWRRRPARACSRKAATPSTRLRPRRPRSTWSSPTCPGLAGQGLATCWVAAERRIKVLDFVPPRAVALSGRALQVARGAGARAALGRRAGQSRRLGRAGAGARPQAAGRCAPAGDRRWPATASR